jgi:nucleoside-diphosphate-sugar epimerase
VQWVEADLINPLETNALLIQFQPTHLLHFAWYAEPGKFWNAPENFQWVQASLSLLQSFARNGGRRMVSAGTCAEYDWNYGYCVEQRTPLVPATIYGTCKNALKSLQSAFCRQAGISQAWGRIFFLYGPREHPNRLVASVINALRHQEPARCSHGSQIRDFMHVQDAAEAFVALLDSEVEGPVNIASGKPVALKEVIYKIADRLNRPELVELGAIPSPPDDPPLLLADARRLTQEVGWKPRFDLASGLEQTIHWWQEQ